MSNHINDSIVSWIARIGAASAVDVAEHLGLTRRAATVRLGAAQRAGLLRVGPRLGGEPALYMATRAGLRAAGLDALPACRISPGAFAHAGACARLAVALARANPQSRLASERELRLAERLAGRPIASAEVGRGRDGEPALHRPDLVLFGADGAVAIEVELTVKSPPRLRAIIRGWGRSRLVRRVVYYATPGPARAVQRAVDALYAADRVTVVEVDAAQAIALAPCNAIAVGA
jgi:hypothetical protein